MQQHSAWQDIGQGPAAPRVEPVTALSDRSAPDVLVIGMGASGLEATAALARRGADVVALDAVGIAAGAAGANGGFLLAGLAMFHHAAVTALGRETAVDWYRRTLGELDRLADHEPTFRRVGSVRTAADATETADIEAHLRGLRDDDLPARPYDGPLGRGLLVPGDGVFHPVARCRRLAVAALEAGATLVAPARVTRLGPGGIQVAGLDRPLSSQRVLVAVDGGLERLVPGLTGRVRTARLQMLATAATDEVDLRHPVYHRTAWTTPSSCPRGRSSSGEVATSTVTRGTVRQRRARPCSATSTGGSPSSAWPRP
jgi:gamma-glutamylputrescine oxidase